MLGHGPSLAAGDGAAQVSEPVPAASVQLKSLPLVIFSHGMAGMRAISSAVCCDLASHGYVVGAVEHRCVQIRSTVPRPFTCVRFVVLETILPPLASEECLYPALMGSSLLTSGWSFTGRKMMKRSFLFGITRLLT